MDSLISSLKFPLALTRYSLSIIEDGCMSLCASSPLFVINKRPVVLTSSLPIEIQLVDGSGKLSNIVAPNFCGFLEHITPRCLFSMIILVG